MVYVDEPIENKEDKKSPKKPSLPKKITTFHMESLLQNLIDDNELQTAVLAAVMIRNK